MFKHWGNIILSNFNTNNNDNNNIIYGILLGQQQNKKKTIKWITLKNSKNKLN